MTRRIFIVPMLMVLGSVVVLGCGGDEEQPVESVEHVEHVEQTDLETGAVITSKAICFHGSHGQGGWQSAWTGDKTVTKNKIKLHKEENPEHFPTTMTKKSKL